MNKKIFFNAGSIIVLLLYTVSYLILLVGDGYKVVCPEEPPCVMQSWKDSLSDPWTWIFFMLGAGVLYCLMVLFSYLYYKKTEKNN